MDNEREVSDLEIMYNKEYNRILTETTISFVELIKGVLGEELDQEKKAEAISYMTRELEKINPTSKPTTKVDQNPQS